MLRAARLRAARMVSSWLICETASANVTLRSRARSLAASAMAPDLTSSAMLPPHELNFIVSFSSAVNSFIATPNSTPRSIARRRIRSANAPDAGSSFMLLVWLTCRIAPCSCSPRKSPSKTTCAALELKLLLNRTSANPVTSGGMAPRKPMCRR